MHFPIVFVWFLLAIFIFRHHLRKNSKLSEHASKEFWEKEEASLVVRKQALNKEDYLIPNLPTSILQTEAFFANLNLPSLFRQQTQLSRLSTQPMVNFQTMSNAELRLKYGTATLTSIELYEENYTQYIQLLFLMGKNLYQANKVSLATIYLEEGVAIGSDIKEHYLLLAKIYATYTSMTSLTQLIEKAKTLRSLTSATLVTELEALYPISNDHNL